MNSSPAGSVPCALPATTAKAKKPRQIARVMDMPFERCDSDSAAARVAEKMRTDLEYAPLPSRKQAFSPGDPQPANRPILSHSGLPRAARTLIDLPIRI